MELLYAREYTQGERAWERGYCAPTERNLHITDKQHLPAAAQSGAAKIAVQSDCRTAKLFGGVATTTTSGKSFVPSLVCDNSGANLVMWGMIRLRPAPHVLEIRSKHFLGHQETCGYCDYCLTSGIIIFLCGHVK